ncbi:MAG: outer membrane protein assembly factor BamA [Acidobacteria bacterium]|nr:outer membrane protein assembly factor BamA [Acidobacteriota bacterium]MBI3664479.1 outer membrane protein assembly factor BamA [Acidobacteriota bacterium]
MKLATAAIKKLCLRWAAALLFVCVVGAGAPSLCAQQSSSLVIQRIEIVGNRRIPRDTLKARIFSREGDAYSEESLHRDFQALWNTQYFEDIRLEVEPSPDRPEGRIVVFYVKERPVIRRIEYKNAKSVTESEILERFKDRKVGLSVESQFDPTRIKRAEVVLKELLGERGRQFAVIKTTYERIAATNAIKLTFNIEEGPKVKVGTIIIEGNTAFSDRRIIRAMRNSRPYAVPLYLFEWNVLSKTFDRRKLAEDLEVGIRGLYQDYGYFQVLVKEPRTNTVDIDRGGLPGPWPLLGRKHGKRTNITIPIQEGERFRLGKVFVRSSDPEKGLYFKTDFLVDSFPIKPGEIFAVDKVRKALEEYRKLYGTFGFIDFTATPLTDIDQPNKTINLTLEFDEQKQFFVRRIEFSGNTTTRDKVIRREVLLDEGDLFNNRAWEVSILRLNQLDYFEPIKPEHAELKRNLKEGTVDINLKVKEKGKQSIGLTGGVSGIAGSFIGLSYQTNNFLGLGETLTFSADFGDRQRNFIFGFTEPYLFDRPISSGFTIFNSRFSYNQARETSILLGQNVQVDPTRAQNYNQNRKGFSLFASYPLRRFAFTRLGVTYSYTDSTIAAFSDASRLLFENLQFRQLAGPSALRGIRSSKITPTISHNTVDNPINPTSGKSFFYAFNFEGGFLQGNVNTISHTFEGKYFRPVNKRRNVIGVRMMASFTTGFGGIVLPPFNRFYLGGEDSVRGFDFFSISPWAFVPTSKTVQLFFLDPQHLDSNGNPTARFIQVPVLDYVATTPGGDSQFVSNLEYRVPIIGPVSMSLFIDTGLNGLARKSQLQLDSAGVQKLRQQFPNTTVNNRLDIASGSNFKLRSSAGIEFVVQLPIVNAPFRIYWAYNYLRYKQDIIEPRGDFFISDELKRTLPPGVLDSQILPQLNAQLTRDIGRGRPFEPLKTFRFTVSRTF